MRIKLLTFILATLISAESFAQTNYPFQTGEELNLVIHFKWAFNADIANLNFKLNEIKEADVPCYHLYIDMKTNKFFDSFYKVRDIYESKFEIEDLDPVYFKRAVNEGGYIASNDYTWSNDKMKLRAKVEKSTRPPVDTTFDTGEVIRDVMNAIYYLRTADFDKMAVGSTSKYVTALDRNTQEVIVTLAGREEKKIPGYGTFKTIKLSMEISERNPETEHDSKIVVGKAGDKKTTAYIWLSDDPNRIPLYFSIPITMGKIEARTTSVKGAKYPLTSKIN